MRSSWKTRFQREPELGSAQLIRTVIGQSLFEPLISPVRNSSKGSIRVGLWRLTGEQLVNHARHELGRCPALNPGPVLLESE